jgi:hypothetical protein
VRIGFKKRPQTAQDFFHGLVEFRLIRVAFFRRARKDSTDSIMGKVSANLLSLEAFEPDFNKRRAQEQRKMSHL